jgi:hypothetical protein
MVKNFGEFGGETEIRLDEFNGDFRAHGPRGREEEVSLEHYESGSFTLEGAVFDMKQLGRNVCTRCEILEIESLRICLG